MWRGARAGTYLSRLQSGSDVVAGLEDAFLLQLLGLSAVLKQLLQSCLRSSTSQGVCERASMRALWVCCAAYSQLGHRRGGCASYWTLECGRCTHSFLSVRGRDRLGLAGRISSSASSVDVWERGSCVPAYDSSASAFDHGTSSTFLALMSRKAALLLTHD